jgi:putative transcriptional regulator
MEGEIIFNIDVMLAKRKMSVTELSQRVGITMANISILKNGKAKAIKVSTLAKHLTASREICWNIEIARNCEGTNSGKVRTVTIALAIMEKI